MNSNQTLVLNSTQTDSKSKSPGEPSDEALLNYLSRLVGNEREIQKKILEALLEIEVRKLHLKRGYPSLFAFCTEVLGYSAGSAMRRIEAMKLIKNLSSSEQEEVKKEIVSGKLNLTKLGLVARVVKEGRAQKTDLKLRPLDLIKLTSETETLKCERALVEVVGIRLPSKETKFQGVDGELRITVTLDKEAVELLERFKEVTSHQNPRAETAKALKIALRVALQKLDLKEKASREKRATPKSQKLEGEGFTSRMETRTEVAAEPNAETFRFPKKPSTYIRRKDLRQLYQTEAFCEWKDAKTKRICGSRFFLQTDHIHPRSRGGGSERENLQLLCGAHNRLKGVQILQRKKVVSRMEVARTIG